MLIEDRSTAPDNPPQAPRRWPKRLLVGGLVTLVVGAVAAFVVSAFALSGSSIEEDSGSLGKDQHRHLRRQPLQRQCDRGGERRRRSRSN